MGISPGRFAYDIADGKALAAEKAEEWLGITVASASTGTATVKIEVAGDLRDGWVEITPAMQAHAEFVAWFERRLYEELFGWTQRQNLPRNISDPPG